MPIPASWNSFPTASTASPATRWPCASRRNSQGTGSACGPSIPRFAAPFTPCVEIGWRLAFDHWRQGYATEAARLALARGFGPLALPAVVSFTAVANRRSRAVMERLGMTRGPAEGFDLPTLPQGHPLGRQMLYRLGAGEHVARG